MDEISKGSAVGIVDNCGRRWCVCQAGGFTGEAMIREVYGPKLRGFETSAPVGTDHGAPGGKSSL
jgi:hypothetical protein